MAETKNKPEKVFRVQLIKATVWANVGKDKQTGKEFVTHSVNLTRSYKDSKDEWQDTTSMRKVDLPVAIKVLNQAYDYVLGITSSDDSEKD